jgi:3-keto-disaccharide hydrolase
MIKHLVSMAALMASAALAQEKKMTRYDFESDTAGQPPKGFQLALTGKGQPGKWVVQVVDDAPSGKKVLAQTDADTTDYRFPIAYTGPELKDLRLSVKCKPVAGKGDQGCGIVWRLRDPDNYYITRANALEDNVHLYRVVQGRRIRFEGWDGKVKSGVWHDLAVEMVGDHIQVFFNGDKVIDARDDAFKEAGKFGVWTKADSIVLFDDLTATPK